MRKKLTFCSKILVLSFLCWLSSTGLLYDFARRGGNASKSTRADISEGFRKLQVEVQATHKQQQEAGMMRHNAANLRLLQDYKNDQIDEEFIIVKTLSANESAAPPPLKSISAGGDGSLLRVKTPVVVNPRPVIHKDNGFKVKSLKDDERTNDLLARIAADPTMKRLNTRMDFRRKTMSFHCQQLGLKDMPPTPKMKVLYSEAYKLAYCTVPKAGSTNMKKLLWVLNGKVKSMDEIEKVVSSSDFHRLTSELYQKSTMLDTFDDSYARLLIVRHPFERLLSSYHNKLTPDSKGVIQYANLSQTIRQMFGTPLRRKEVGEHASFEEFIDFVTDPNTRSMGHGPDHWLRYDELCSPCSIPYNVIAHLETINDDMRYLLRLVGAPTEYQFLPGYSKSGVSFTTKRSAIDIFKQLPREKVKKLYETYKNDFLLFSYSARDYL